jgi:hypothetical protein
MTAFICPALAFSLNPLTEGVQLNTVHSAERRPNSAPKGQQKQDGCVFSDPERRLNGLPGVQSG